MHSYQHNIKTFNNATRFLTRVERSLYRDLIELYYDSEKPLPADNFDRLARLVLANTDDEKKALEYVLGEFFTKSGDFYTHDYCDEQIEKFHSNTTAKALAGKASAKARHEKQEQRKREREKQNSTGVEQLSTDAERNPTNQKPETSNHNKPEININTPQAAPPATPEKKSRKVGSRLPDDWRPTQDYVDAAMQLNPDYTREWFSATAHKFRDYWVAKTGKDATKADWLATWRNWVRNDLEYNRGKRNAGQPQQLDDTNTDWINRVFPNSGIGEQDFPVTESDFPSLEVGGTIAGALQSNAGGMAQGANGEWD